MADTDSDIFAAAMSDAPIEAAATESNPAPAPVEQPAAVAQPTPSVEQPASDPLVTNEQGHRVPLSELLEQREKRQAAERRAEEVERRMSELQAQMRASQQPPRQIPDVLEDPSGFAGHVRTDVEGLVRNQIVNMTFEDVREQNPEAFDAAWRALQGRIQSGDSRTAAEIRNATNPGRALMKWHQREQTLQSIGDGGLDGYRQRALDEALKDPAFRQKAMEAWREEAQANTQPRSPNTPSLPSLNRTTGAAAGASRTAVSDAELFQTATARR